MDFVTAIGDVLRLDPSARALVFRERWYTYGDLARAIDTLDRELAAAGVTEGTPVAAVLPNSPASVVAILALMFRRACIVPISPRRSTADLATVQPVHTVLRVASEDDADLTWRIENGVASSPARPGVAALIGTAGTTGPPKRIEVPYASIDASLAGTRSKAGGKKRTGLREDTTIVCFPLAHLSGLVPMLITVLTGRRVALMAKFDPAEAARIVSANAITSLALNPTAIAMLLDADVDPADLSTLRFVRSGSAPLSVELAEEFERRYGVKVMQAYGQTETGGEVIGWSPSEWDSFGDTKRGSVGRPVAGIEVRTVTRGTVPDDTDGEGLPVGESGELWLRGVRGHHGWHRTGDLARVDSDGFVWVEGRADDLIICGGFNIAPLAIEHALERHPAIREAAVVGVPDRRLVEIPVAVIVLRAGLTADDAELDAWCRGQLEPYQVPRRYVRVAALPRNDAGKVHRPTTREHALASTAG